MLKFVVLALISFAFAGAQETAGNNQQSNDQEQADQYREAYLKYTGQSVSALRECHGNEAVAPTDVEFYFHRLNSVAVRTVNDADLPPAPYFNASWETKVYIHGWLEQYHKDLASNVSLIFAARQRRVNLVYVKWNKYSNCLNYYSNIGPQIATYVSQMVQKLIQKGANEKRIHLAGVGVGAHIAGLAGKAVGPSKVGRITGLSPLGLWYNSKPETERLAKGDADFVDVIHTNKGVFGISKIIGDLDFLPNGGRQQPLAEGYPKLLQDIASHMAALVYYSESIAFGTGGFIGRECNSWKAFTEPKENKCLWNQAAVMGEHVSKEVNGVVYLYVNANSPYSRGIAGLHSAANQTPESSA